MGAVAATIDVIIVIGFFSLFGSSPTSTVLGGLLAIIGYALNDTGRDLDRIRENFRKAAQGLAGGNL